jgi:hypothetical protein
MTDFFSSEAGRCAGLAKAFLEGARVLDEAQLENGRILFPPTLALAGHGLELMLKACFHIHGQKPPTKGRKGHEIELLWVADVCEPLRSAAYANAKLAAEIDRTNPRYLGVPDAAEVPQLIKQAVLDLCKLHGGEGYPLRYPPDDDKVGPRTPLLVKALWRTADDLVKRPTEFLLRRHTGNS